MSHVEPSTHAITSAGRLCVHYGECGGCAHQDVPYPEQVACKRATLEELFADHWQGPIDVHPSPVIWYYRNKVDFNFGLKHYPEPPPKGFERELVIGFKRKGRWFWQLDMEECRIASPEMGPLLEAVRSWAKTEGLRPFHTRSKQGFLKMLLVREGKRTGDRMVALITRPGECNIEGFRDAVLNAYPATTVQWAVDESFAPAANIASIETLHGPEVIHEELHVPANGGMRNLRFRISPASFFQTNTLGTEILYGRIRDWVAQSRPDALYDLYGGSGGIALSVADLVPRIESIEVVSAATEDGRSNATANDVENVTFITEKVKNYLKYQLESGGFPPNALAILDPSRAGLHPKALKRIMELRPERLIYVSCKPSVFRQELDTFHEGYRITKMEAVDLFPHTDHVEVLAYLERR